MKFDQFNKQYTNKFRYVEIDPYICHGGTIVRRFMFEQWCPLAESWHRMLIPGNWDHRFVGKKGAAPDAILSVDSSIPRRLDNLPRYVVVCKEKHGTMYFDGADTEAIGRTALFILEKRLEVGYYEPEDDPKPPGNKPEELKDALLIKTCEDEWRRYRSNLKYARESRHFYRAVHTALENINYYAAAKLLELRVDYQYEDFDIVSLEKV